MVGGAVEWQIQADKCLRLWISEGLDRHFLETLAVFFFFPTVVFRLRDTVLGK